MSETQIEGKIDEVVSLDPRYDEQAYHFIFDVLDFTIASLGRQAASGPERHVTVDELLDGVRRHALDQFGPLARIVLESWGLFRTEDVGEVVFNMIDVGLLNARDEDSKEDFAHGYSFREALDQIEPEIPWEQLA